MKANEVMQMCRERGITVMPRGQAWHLLGNGIDVIVARLDSLGASDLLPAYASLSKTSRLATSQTPTGREK